MPILQERYPHLHYIRFKNEYEKIGPEFSQIDDLRDKFIEANRGTYVPKPVVPLNVQGLVPRTGRTPEIRRWWRRISSFERNGYFNFHTPVLNVRISYMLFYFLLGWGLTVTPLEGTWYENNRDSQDVYRVVYDKMAPRDIPLARVWSRPG